MLTEIGCQMELKIELLKVTEMKLALHCLNISAVFATTLSGNAVRKSNKLERCPFYIPSLSQKQIWAMTCK